MPDTDNKDDMDTEDKAPSFAAIQKPHVADGGDQLLLLWGRFWSNAEKTAGGFFTQFNLDQNNVDALRVSLYEDADRLDDYDPDQSPNSFKQSLPEEPSSASDVPRADLQLFEQKTRKILDDREGIKNLRSFLENKQRSDFNDWIYDFFTQIVKKGDLTYQVKGQLTTKSMLNNRTNGSREDGGEETKDQSTTDHEENDEDNRNYLPINVSTSPMNGDFPADLQPGQEIFVRATGSIVDKLPDDMVDDRYDHASIQLEATITDVLSEPSLPPDFDGDPSDYWAVRVSFLENKYGEGFVHRDEQVKLVNPGTDESSDELDLPSPTVLIASGVVLLGILVLAYLIFGV